MDCEQAETHTAHAQLRSGRHDNAKVTVTTPKRVQQAGCRHCTASDTRAQWTAAATGYKRLQRLEEHHYRQSTARTSASNSNHDETAR